MFKDYITAQERIHLSKKEVDHIRNHMIKTEQMRLNDLSARLVDIDYQSRNINDNAEKIHKNIKMLNSSIFRRL